MITDFSNLSNTAKIWIFPSSRKFYKEEVILLHEKLISFLTNWLSGDTKIETSFLVKYDRFIIIGSDDSSTKLTLTMHEALAQFILQLEQEFKVTLFDRINVCFKQGDFVQYKEIREFKKLIKDNGVSGKTIVFNNLVATKLEFEENWEIPLSESWLNHLIKSH